MGLAQGALAREPAARSYDRDDIGRAYDEHAPYLFRSLRHLGVADSDIDDALQEIFLVLVRRAPELDDRSSLRSWLFGVALRIGRRARQVRARTAAREVEVEVETRAPGPFEATASARDAELLLRALDHLPDTHREAFVLMELEELTAPEVSSLLGVKLNTIYSRLRLARKDLHEFLARERGGAHG